MNSIAEHKIFTPFTIGRVSLRHRVVMAPLTRLRSEQPGDVPGPLMAQYYEQRTSPGGLIITESAEITPRPVFAEWNQFANRCVRRLGRESSAT